MGSGAAVNGAAAEIGRDRVEGVVVFRDGRRLGRGLVRRELAICFALAARAERVNLTGISVRYLMVISETD